MHEVTLVLSRIFLLVPIGKFIALLEFNSEINAIARAINLLALILIWLFVQSLAPKVGAATVET